MKKILPAALALVLLAACPPERPQQLEAIGPPDPLASFSPENDKTIEQTGVTVDDGGWRIEVAEPGSVPLFEITENLCDICRIDYHAQLKSQDLEGKAYIELWARVPGKGEFFSRGLDRFVRGTREWSSAHTPFYLMEGQKPDLLRVGLKVEGTGTVWIKDVSLTRVFLGDAPAGHGQRGTQPRNDNPGRP